MGTEKRARQKANRAAKMAEVELEEANEKREVATKKWGKIAAVVGGVIALIVLINVLRSSDEAPVPEFASSDAQDEPTPVPEIVLLDSVPDDFEPFAGEGALALVAPEARNGAYDSPPPMTIDPAATYAAVIDTTVGAIRFNLFADEAPETVNNFVSLARDGFYDGVSFHRVIPGFMAQGGDPTGTGTGGPGYNFGDEVDSGRPFGTRGQLAMDNAGPGTNGSQFFITFATSTDLELQSQTNLTGKHTIFGELADESPALDRIPATGVGEIVLINSVRIIGG